MTRRSLRHPLLTECGVEHGFGTRRSGGPADVVCPNQVHGAAVARVDARSDRSPREADAVVSNVAGRRIGVVTADCLPVLFSTSGGTAVAAAHAGWRGLAAGVLAASVNALREIAGSSTPLVAAIGPCIGPCCYEIDAPVIDALAKRFPDALEGALRPAREGRAMLDLGGLARSALVAAGLAPAALGSIADACTCCDPVRFHSYRRDGPKAGRLVHFIAARAPEA